jgi:hypothetical protein
MELVYNIVVFVHLIGMASLVGGALVQMSAPGERVINAPMRHGAGIQLITGLILVGMAEGIDDLDKDIPVAKIAVKLGVALVVIVLAEKNRNRKPVPDQLFFLVFGLAIVNVAVAALWR